MMRGMSAILLLKEQSEGRVSCQRQQGSAILVCTWKENCHSLGQF